MTKPKRENYDKAARRIAEGYWKVDIVNGTLAGPQGRPCTRTNTDGYLQMKFRDPEQKGKDVAVLVHRVIYEHVHGPVSEDLTINHINGDKLDNRPSNREAITQIENVKHAVATGLYHANCWYCRHNGKRHIKGERMSNAKLEATYHPHRAPTPPGAQEPGPAYADSDTVRTTAARIAAHNTELMDLLGR